MKQLPMTPALSAQIKAAVGEDVDTENLAVFEAISLNTKPLPGKRGTIFENARVMPVTLNQMANWLNDGKHIPLISNHWLGDDPKGRAFAAGLEYSSNGEVELRTLFYLDSTETQTITKLNSGSIDEVSVQFLSTQMLCSHCGWDYFGPEKNSEAFWDLTCANGHKIGTDGTHVMLVGLQDFLELSLVARGAADTPKIVGKSASKLAPATQLRLAASGIEPHALICSGTVGEELVSTANTPDFAALADNLVNARVEVATLTASNTSLTAEVTALQSQVGDLTTQLEAARGQAANAEDYNVALAFLGDVYSRVATAAGENAEAPKTVAELKAGIERMTSNLTAILPVGGVADPAGNTDEAAAPKIVASAFTVNRK